ncbi:uncharacterized protein [Drosophila takahashii]|uniref:uncharacterized protein isoform X1 n=2 Tax=Drosophila takahashii TaxID=29030 RepID=UPI001CF86BA0|nr:uncharacterized protein LOC108060105 [Drosophila takahashii]
MKCTAKKCCCCDLRWGALTIAIIDMIMAAAVVLETKYLTYYQGWWIEDRNDPDNIGKFESNYYPSTYYAWMVTFVIHFAHLVACVLVILSVWVQLKKLVIAYLIIGSVRILYDLVFLIYVCVEVGAVVVTLLLILGGFGVAIYFWFVAYSWFKMLGGSTRAD